MAAKHLSILRQVVNLPTAPFVEGRVIAYIRKFVAARPRLALSADQFGNLLVRYRPATTRKIVGKPVLFAAHMDHPGFVAIVAEGAGRIRAEFRGWVSTSYFAGERIQFFSGGRWVNGRIEKVIPSKPAGKKEKRAAASASSFRDQQPPEGVIAKVASDVAPGSPGMWAIPDAVIRDNKIHARACDDLAGLAAVLCMLDEVCRRKIASPCYAFFTRAEEVGFAGALAAVNAKTVPRNALVVAVECSKAITGVSLGAGPVLRVGDKASVFTPSVTAYCQVVAESLAAKDRSFLFQRKLMDGGTCESTAYCHYGYDATGICLPLGNYHNMDAVRGRIGPEYVDVRDFTNLVKWFVALAESPAKMKFDGSHPGLDKRLKTLHDKHRPVLLKTARREG
jgi:endoglucanase